MSDPSRKLSACLTPGNITAFFLIPLGLSLLLIIKVFLVPDCMAFDCFDDANHTFAGFSVFRDILAQGEIPLINLFNNFGTPLLGDPISHFFAPHTVTYYFLSGPVAMTVNRFVLVFCTILALTVYFRRCLSKVTSSFCAFLVFFQLAFLWPFAHHFYQTALLYSVLAFILQERFLEKGGLREIVLLYVVQICMVLSVTLNFVCYFIPFFLLNPFFAPRPVAWRRYIALLAVLAAAFVFSYPQTLWTLKTLPSTIRLNWLYNFYQIFMPQDVLTGLVFPKVLVVWKRFVYFSLPVLVLLGIGILHAFRGKPARRQGFRITFLGVLPFLFVLIMLVYPNLWYALPFVKHTDITRVWWVSNIFLMMGVGKGLDSLRDSDGRFLYPSAVLAVSGGVFLFYLWILKSSGYLYYAPRLELSVLLAGILAYFFAAVFLKKGGDGGPRKREIALAAAYGLVLTAALWASGRPFFLLLELDKMDRCHESSHFFANNKDAVFQPQSFLSSIQPYSRIATNQPTRNGQDFKAGLYHILGSNSRHPLANLAFMEYLKKEGLIQIEKGQPVYYFKPPWDREKLGRLGIRYVLEWGWSDQPVDPVWRPLAVAAFDPYEPKFVSEPFRDKFGILYENPDPVSLVYLDHEGRPSFLPPESISFRGNGLSVNLPPLTGETELVAAFVALPGWKASVNKTQPAEIYHGEDQLIRLKVKPGDSTVSLRYAPFEPYHFVLGILASLLMMLLTAAVTVKKQAAPSPG